MRAKLNYLKCFFVLKINDAFKDRKAGKRSFLASFYNTCARLNL